MEKTVDQTIIRVKVDTKPFDGQKPGTSGLRKKVTVFSQQHYTENFIQSIFNSLRKDQLSPNNSLLIGGDGRYFTKQAISIICRIACANGVDELHIALNGLMSTPACSAYIRNLNKVQGNCLGGILLTASHNPGGPEEDFGIKYNSRNGGPAQQEFTDLIYKESTQIKEYMVTDYKFLTHQQGVVDISKTGSYQFTHVQRPSKPIFRIKVVESVQHYVQLMKSQFDFQAIQRLLNRNDFKMVLDGLYGAAGPYAQAIFTKQLKSQNVKLLNCVPKDDFNKGHPDPNLKQAHQLVEIMGLGDTKSSEYSFGAACDGDADRNMIVGKCFFVTPSDSLAILTANYKLFLKAPLYGVARSMPTSGAVDIVAKKLGINCKETPTGWKFFGNLMQEDLITICGEQSFGTGSSHVREKDGIWTILAWLNVIANKNIETKQGQLMGVEQIVRNHWKQYGRNYYCRYDYEGIPNEQNDKVGDKLWKHIQEQVPKYKQGKITASIFNYEDPVDKSISKNQGIIFKYEDGSRVIFRKSGTGSSGLTLRMYLEKYDPKDVDGDQFQALKDMIQFGLQVSQVREITGKQEPDVKT